MKLAESKFYFYKRYSWKKRAVSTTVQDSATSSEISDDQNVFIILWISSVVCHFEIRRHSNIVINLIRNQIVLNNENINNCSQWKGSICRTLWFSSGIFSVINSHAFSFKFRILTLLYFVENNFVNMYDEYASAVTIRGWQKEYDC